MNNGTNTDMNETTAEANKQLELISASDIEKFGYCPLSWYLHYTSEREQGSKKEAEVDNTARRILEKGEADHRRAGEDMGDIMKKQGVIESTNISWIAFVVIALMLAANGALLIFMIAFDQNSRLLSQIVASMALLWIVVAVYYFISLLLTERKMHLPFLRILKVLMASPPKRPEKKTRFRFKREMLKLAVILLCIAAVLIFNASFYLLDMDREIWQNILIVLSLVWMMGTSIVLFLSLRSREQEPPYRNKLLIGFITVASCLAVSAFIIGWLEEFTRNTSLTQSLLIIASVWLLFSLVFLYMAFFESFRIMHNVRRVLSGRAVKRSTSKDGVALGEEITRHERGVLFFALIAIFLGLNSLLVGLNPRIEFAYILEIISLIWLIGASFFLFLNLSTQKTVKNLKQEYKIDEKATVRYSDTLPKKDKKPKLFKSQKLRISGRPDAILEMDGHPIPVELKTGKIPQGPYFSHILQLGTYGLLMEEEYGTLPPYGLIKYGPKGEEKEFKVEFDKRLMFTLAGKVGEMRMALDSGDVHRNHNRPGKCSNCSRRHGCPETLVK